MVAVEVDEPRDVPEGMSSYVIPEEEYVVFSFEKKYIGEFWNTIYTEENQLEYNIDLAKPRFEVFASQLDAAGMVERYIPTKN